jgi:hypothetical protein
MELLIAVFSPIVYLATGIIIARANAVRIYRSCFDSFLNRRIDPEVYYFKILLTVFGWPIAGLVLLIMKVGPILFMGPVNSHKDLATESMNSANEWLEICRDAPDEMTKDMARQLHRVHVKEYNRLRLPDQKRMEFRI